MSEISTRIWLDEGLWDEITQRATKTGTTVRELIPQLVRQCLGATPVVPRATPAPAVATAAPPAASGHPAVTLSEMYTCGVCGAEVKVGGLSMHLNKHIKEQHAAEAERS